MFSSHTHQRKIIPSAKDKLHVIEIFGNWDLHKSYCLFYHYTSFLPSATMVPFCKFLLCLPSTWQYIGVLYKPQAWTMNSKVLSQIVLTLDSAKAFKKQICWHFLSAHPTKKLFSFLMLILSKFQYKMSF